MNVELSKVNTFVAPNYPKSEEDTNKILILLRNSFLTKSLSPKDQNTLA